MPKKPAEDRSSGGKPSRLKEIEHRRQGGMAKTDDARALRKHVEKITGTSKGASVHQKALQRFPHDPDRAPNLYAAFVEVRGAMIAAAHTQNLDMAECRKVASAVLAGFREPAAPTAPDAAPERWALRDLNLRENPPAFIRRVYAPWLGKGLARKDISRLDDELYKALSVWLYRHPDDEIAKELPPQSDVLDELIDKLSAEWPLETLRKLGYAIDARMRRKDGRSETS